MFNHNKYRPQFFMPPQVTYDWIKKTVIEKPPIWCSVDLRDGNQALAIPMSIDEKLEMFKMLVKIGFKEIEVAFPAASETEYAFLRTLIDENLIPDDVKVQVLTQSREHIIKKTFDALSGVNNAIVHIYNSTSEAQRRQVFKKDKDEIKKIATDGALSVKELAKGKTGNYSFQYSPESFPGTEPEYALEVCNAVLDVWQPTKDNKAYINIPTTVQNSMPHIFASQVEYMHKNISHRDGVILSVHPHNDRGCGVPDAEFGVLAGADKVEGTLFGNGERTGNVDLVTLAMNMYSQGFDPKLDFSDMPSIIEKFERLTRMQISARQPYSGELVYTAFSGSHQDAIAKSLEYSRVNNVEIWDVPYIPINPEDIGRSYETDVIRINSQSGKGGIGYILQLNYGLKLPYKMNEELSYAVKSVSDNKGKELSAAEIYSVFENNYLTHKGIDIQKLTVSENGEKKVEFILSANGKDSQLSGKGAGTLDATVNALKKHYGRKFDIKYYDEHTLGNGSDAKAVSYVGVEEGGKIFWGCGIDTDILRSSLHALMSAVIKAVKIYK